MATNILQTIIQLRYGTFNEWMNSSIILHKGEAAICTFPSESTIESLSNGIPSNTPPAVGIKIGDGQHYFYQLPWLQGVAADVYSWAKRSTKPTYTAAEISGLQSFLEENFHLSGDITFAPRIYQIIEGTGDNINKYYLRYKENNEDAQWVVDTNHPIDLSMYQKVVDWIGTNIITNPNFPTLGAFSGAHIDSKINVLNVADTPIANQFVTSVNETAGKITVERARPTFSNIDGTLNVEKGGTGQTTLAENHVLVGNGTDSIKLIPIAETIANNNHLVPNNVIKAYVDNAVAGLSGAMHFIGEAAVVIREGSAVDPRIPDYNFAQAQPGDVILYNEKEFVWNGGNWQLLGDESSYAVKGSIKDVDIDAEAAIQQSKIAGLAEAFEGKVDKKEGKTLTSNDFTDELKTKLENLPENAQANVIEHILLNGTEISPAIVNDLTKAINLQINEFDDASRTKLQGIQASAEVNKIEKIIYDSEELVPDAERKVVITPIKHENVIESIAINGVVWPPDTNKQVNIRLDQSALNLDVLEGATIPTASGYTREDVTQVSKKLQLERIAATGNVQDLRQTADTYIILNCGSSTDVI